MALLEVSDLRTSFFLRSGELRVLDGVSLEIQAGEVLGLVGETGSGKSVTAYSITRLLKQPGRVVGGEVKWDGRDLVRLWESELEQEIRGKEISMIFQSPREALNPVITVGRQLTQVLRIRRGMDRREARAEAIRILKSVYISDPESRLDSYPHELSGGMAQRIMIALALSCQPRLLIADEPTTGLDVTTQHQIVLLLRELRDRTGMAILLITHDLALAAQLCDRVAVLYAGRIAEMGPIGHLFRSPRHPYTAALLASRPRLGLQGDILTIPGNVANLMRPPGGCRFHPRCPNATQVCAQQQPPLEPMDPGQRVACHNPMPQRQELAASG
ncbi:MAG: ABC transporter ATP-binding protein [Chloroflexi bacterium]|nr:MAG: ABC transporter ATP-binding protein [Chloroflexota bacterium]